jgi:hypothetical protein
MLNEIDMFKLISKYTKRHLKNTKQSLFSYGIDVNNAPMNRVFLLFTLLFISNWAVSQFENQMPSSTNMISPKAFLDSARKFELDYNTFQITRMTMPIEINGRDMNANVGVKIKKDSVIHISVQLMGSEMMKIEFTRDSLRIFNKLDTKYYNEDYSYFAERMGIPLNYTSIQAILSNQLFCFGKDEVSEDNISLDVNEKGLIQVKYSQNSITQTSLFNSFFRISQLQISDSETGYQLIIDYNDFKLKGNIDFPTTMNVQLIKPKSRTLYTFAIQKIILNRSILFTPNNPDRYRYTELEELIK